MLSSLVFTDYCGISTNFLKQTISSFIDPLFHIFKLSFSSSVVPVQFKIAKVIPICKSGDSSSMDNYRPISLLSSFSKILEKIVASRLPSFFESSNLQYLVNGNLVFAPNILPHIPWSISLTKSLSLLIQIFCDLKKAFDTCNSTRFYFLNSKNTELKTQSSFGLNLT